MFSNFSSSWKACAANWGPLSEIILSGSPNLLYKLSKSSCAAPSAVKVFAQGIKITPFERPWSTTTKIKSKPSMGGKSVIRSIEQLAKGRVQEAPEIGWKAGWDGDRSILNCWQTPHPDT